VALHHQRTVYAITRPGGRAAQQLALRLGAVLLFARVGALVPQALKAVVKGGVVIWGAIHMSDIPSFRFSLLWGERRLGSVGNPTCDDGLAFMRIAGETQLTLETMTYALKDANRALPDLRDGRLTGAAVLAVKPG